MIIVVILSKILKETHNLIMKSFKVLLIIISVVLISISSCTDEVSVDNNIGYTYYQNMAIEDIIKLADYGVWEDIYSSPMNKALVIRDTIIKTYPGRYQIQSDDGGIICNQAYPNETCYTIMIIKNSISGIKDKTEAVYLIVYERFEPSITKLK